MRIETTKFSFKTPKLLSKEEYNSIKIMLAVNPNMAVFKVPTYFEEYQNEVLLATGFITIGPLLAYIAGEGNLFFVLGMFATGSGFFGFVFHIIPEFFSYDNYKAKATNYFSNLKSKIISSKNYDEFKDMY